MVVSRILENRVLDVALNAAAGICIIIIVATEDASDANLWMPGVDVGQTRFITMIRIDVNKIQ